MINKNKSKRARRCIPAPSARIHHSVQNSPKLFDDRLDADEQRKIRERRHPALEARRIDAPQLLRPSAREHHVDDAHDKVDGRKQEGELPVHIKDDLRGGGRGKI